MPLTVIGRPSKYFGKSLYEIACNLKDFGAGRVVIRQAFQRYKEPTYFRIIKVQPAMDPEFKAGRAWVESVFRGTNYGVLEIGSGYKKDFRLIPKEEEDVICNSSFTPSPIRILPRYSEFPPLLKLKIKEEQAKLGKFTEPKLEMIYAKDPMTRARIAEEGETPTVTLVKHVRMNLYEGIIDKRKGTKISG
ncbi:ribosomal protein S34 [Chamberlinius hualienensis]